MRMFVLVVVGLLFLVLASLEVIESTTPPVAEPLPAAPASAVR